MPTDNTITDPPDFFDYPDVAHIKETKPNLAFYLSFKDLHKVPSSWTRADTCPACLGTSLCSAIDAGEVMVELPDEPTEATQKGVYVGRWNHLPIVLQTIDKDNHKSIHFDNFICQNVTGKYNCNVSQAIGHSKSYAVQNKAFMSGSLQNMWKIAKKRESRLVQR